MINGAPTCILGLANKSGWMTGQLFVNLMKHFIQYSYATKENLILLIFDNHDGHLTVETIQLACNNGVTIVTISPHCSNRLQLLDVGVYKS